MSIIVRVGYKRDILFVTGNVILLITIKIQKIYILFRS